MAEKEVAEATTEEVEVVAQAVENLDDLKSKIAQLETDLTGAKTEARSHQAYGRQQKEALDKQRGLDNRIAQLEETLRVVTDMQAEILDKGGEEEVEKPQQRRSDFYKERLNEFPKKSREQENLRFQGLANEADGLLKAIGLTMDKSPETKDAYIMFLLGNPDGGLEEVKRIQRERTEAVKKPSESEEERIERLAEEKYHSKLKGGGYLNIEEGGPSASAKRYEEVRDTYIEDPGNLENKAEYLRLRQQRGL